MEAEVFPKIFECLSDADPLVRKNAATCINTLSNKKVEISAEIEKKGGIAPLAKMVQHSKGTVRLPAIMALKSIAGRDDKMATAVLKSGVVPHLIDVIMNEPQDFMKTAAAKCLGEIGKHNRELSDELAAQPNDVMNVLLALLMEETVD